MQAILTLAMKDIRLLLRDKGGVFFTFAFPAIYAIFFGLIFTSLGDYRGRRIPIFLVDQDRTPQSQAFAAALRDSGEVETADAEYETGVDNVRHGRRPACLVIPPGFGAAREAILAGATTKLQIAIDPARPAESAIVMGAIQRNLMLDVKGLFSDPVRLRAQLATARERLDARTDMNEAMHSALDLLLTAAESAANLFLTTSRPATASSTVAGAWEPMQIEKIELNVKRDRPRNLYAVTFPLGMMWGLLGCTAAFGVGMALERRRGTLRRVSVAPLTSVQILAGKMLASLAVIVSVSAAMLILARVGFGVVPASIPFVAMAVVSIACAFIGIMLLLSNLGRTETSAAGVSWGVLTLLSMLGGGMVPINLMPEWMKTIATCSPVFWSIRALEGGLWREYTLEEMLIPCGVLVGIGVACFSLGAAMLRGRMHG